MKMMTMLAAAAALLVGSAAYAHGGGGHGGGGHSSSHSSSSTTSKSSASPGDHYVSGYTKSNGTYVAGHMQTNADSTRNDNYSTRGNVNPYTGVAGTKPRDEDPK